MRSDDEIMADAADERPFSNYSEFEHWADAGRGCYDCLHYDTPTGCPIEGTALLGKWPKEWTRRVFKPHVDSSGIEVVDECTEFEERRDDGNSEPEPEPEPPPVAEGQVDMFEVWADEIVEHVGGLVAVTRG